MTISADRVSDTEIKVGDTIYTFDAKATADSFQQCLGNDYFRDRRTSSAAAHYSDRLVVHLRRPSHRYGTLTPYSRPFFCHVQQPGVASSDRPAAQENTLVGL